jgi:hypothetical protein
MDRRNIEWNHPEDDAQCTSLSMHVDTEPGDARDRVWKIHFVVGVKYGFLGFGGDLAENIFYIRRIYGETIFLIQVAVDAINRSGGHL